jgi:hypothetical protein
MSTYAFIVQQDGKLPPGMRETLSKVFPSYAGKKISMSISEAKEKRSLDQNAYYHGVVKPHVRKVRMEMGDAKSLPDIHEDLLNQYAPTVTSRRLDGTVYTRAKRSKEMSVQEMATVITAISGDMAAMGWPVPMKDSDDEQ